MSIFQWLEMSRLAEIVAASLWGYPIMLTAHSVGLAIVVGIIFVLDLRMIGCFKGVSYVAMQRMLKLAWVGFVINFLSGCALFTAQASYFITNPTFLVKIAAIFLAAINAAFIQKMLSDHGERWEVGGVVSAQAKFLAISSLALWSIAIIAGRFIAYL